MGFKVLDSKLRHCASRLGVAQHPPGSRLRKALIMSPPENEEQARVMFEYLYSQQSKFESSDWEMLAEAKIIPFRDEKSGTMALTYKSARNCYFKGHSDR